MGFHQVSIENLQDSHQISIDVIYGLDPRGGWSSRGPLLIYPRQIKNLIGNQKKSDKKPIRNMQQKKNRKMNQKKGRQPFFQVHFSVFFLSAISFFYTSLTTPLSINLRYHIYRSDPLFRAITHVKSCSGRSKSNF